MSMYKNVITKLQKYVYYDWNLNSTQRINLNIWNNDNLLIIYFE